MLFEDQPQLVPSQPSRVMAFRAIVVALTAAIVALRGAEAAVTTLAIKSFTSTQKHESSKLSTISAVAVGRRCFGQSLTQFSSQRAVESFHLIGYKSVMNMLLNFVIAYNTLEHSYSFVGSDVDINGLITPQLPFLAMDNL